MYTFKLLGVLIILIVLEGIVDGSSMTGNSIGIMTLKNYCGDTISNNKAKELILGDMVGVSSGKPISVCSQGCDYSGLQAAIDNSVPGGIIEVHSGNYSEDLSLTKQLKFVSIGGPVNYEGVIETNNNAANFNGSGYFNHFASIVCKTSGTTIKQEDSRIIPENSPSILPSEPKKIYVQPSASQIGSNVLYSDDFSRNFNWRDSWATQVNKDGRLHITIIKPNYFNVRNPTIRAFKDCIIEAEATLDDDSQDSALGLVFRNAGYNFYRFKISGKGEFGFDMLANRKWTELVPWTSSADINTGHAPNLIRVQCQGDRFTFFVNGVNLGEYIDNTFPNSGKVGLIADSASSSGVQASFDNLTIRTMTEQI